MLRQLDHVVFVVRDLRAAIDDYRRRGFTVTPGGEHADGVTHNAIVPFADGSYLELVAFHDLGQSLTHPWWTIAADGGGLADFALLSDDLAADTAALADLVRSPPQEGGRIRPDGIELRWRTAVLKIPLPFVIEDLTARELRVPGGAATEHANGATGIASVVVGAVDIGDTEWRYAALRERGAPQIELRKAERDGLLDVRFRSD
jgi:catechol 2,3-dioxygenase-like lactoylglutathione lyase family enzyme